MIILNEEQKAAVETKSKRALVVGIPGGGKTRVLTERIAHLTEHEKVSSYEIVACTFTRLASGEMRKRLEERIGRASYGMEISTMHALALKMIHRFSEFLGVKSNCTVYGDFETNFIIRDVAASMGVLKGKTWKVPKKEIDAMFRAYYQTGIEPEKTHPGYKVFKSTMARFKENNSLCFDGLLIGLKLLIPTIAKYTTIKHVLVDEVQDNSTIQWEIINELCAACGASLFVVGDIDQNLYSFRGAVPEYMVEHQHEFDIFRLTKNYRSGSRIVEAANKLIKHNVERIDNTMEATRENGVIEVHKGMDSEAIASRIASLLSSGHKVDAILCRIHAPLAKLSGLLDERGITHHYVGKGSKLTNTEDFRRFCAFLKLIVNGHDNFSFLLVKDIIGLTSKEYAHVRMQATINMQSHFTTWCSMHGETSPWHHEFFGIDLERDAGECIDTLQTCLEENGHTEFEDSYKFAIDNLPADNNLQTYLDWLAVYDIQDDLQERDDRMQLCTVHSAKGLEWPTVMVIGCNEGLMPSKQAEKNGEIEAERRLAYVAYTRAADNLILAVRPEKSEVHGKVYESPISRFVGEALEVRYADKN